MLRMESGHDLLLPPVFEENVCLPLAVNAVSKYWGVDLPLSEAAEISRTYPSVDGSILIEGVEMAERYGLACEILHSSLDGLKSIINQEVPPVVILPGVQNTIQHASVISGYDDTEGTVLHYIPQMGRGGEFQVGAIPAAKFNDMWSEDGRLMILIAPHDRILSLPLPDASIRQSSRLCFESEKQNLLRRTDDAIRCLKKAISLDPSNSTAYALLAGILNEQGSPRCIKHYEECIRINDRSYLAYRGLGNYHIKAKRFAEAEKYYSTAISVNPSRYGPIYKNRGIARLEQGDRTGARRDLEEYLKQVPRAPDGASIRTALREL